jgi:hypothetical protein
MRRPIEASSPIVLNENDFKGRSESDAAIFCATMFPSRMACCAVRGCDFPGFLISGTNAQSPTAQTLGQSGTCKNWFTSSRPCSFGHGSEKMSGLGTAPAVHTKLRVGIERPSTKDTFPSVMLLTRALNRISTPRRASTFCAYRPRPSPSSGKITGPE